MANKPAASTPSVLIHDRVQLSRILLSAPIVVKICIFGMLTVFALAFFAPWIVPFDPNKTSILNSLKAPSWTSGGHPEHLLGTDRLGRDMLSRLIYGLRVSIGLSVLGVVIGGLIGTALGILAGFVGGILDRTVSALVDIQIAIPFLLMTLVAIAALGTDIWVLIGLLGVAGWETYARVVRSQVIAIRSRPFVEAAYAGGATHMRVALREVLPNLVAILTVLLTLNFPAILLLEASLSFLGLGVQPPTPSLGRMVGDNRNDLALAWWTALTPVFLILIVTLMIQLIGDWLRDVFDSRLRDGRFQ